MAEENMERNMDEAAAEEMEKNGQPEKDAASEPAKEKDKTQEADKTQETEEETGENGQEEKKENKKDKKETLIEELNDRIRRQMAEFENFRKRSDREKSGMFEMGAKSVIEQLLPIVDNFERGLQAVPQEQKEDPFVDGMEKVYRQMTEMLEKIGVKPIEAVGQTFNPDYHNAVMHEDDEDGPENTVTEEFLKGYTYKGQVVRHSMVKVVN